MNNYYQNYMPVPIENSLSQNMPMQDITMQAAYTQNQWGYGQQYSQIGCSPQYGYASQVGINNQTWQMLEETRCLNAQTAYSVAQRRYDKEQKNSIFEFRIQQARNALLSVTAQWLHPPIPIESWEELAGYLPTELREECYFLAKTYGWSPVAALICTLFFCSAATWGKYNISVAQGWRETLCLFMLITRPSGGRKTSLLNALKEVFEQFEAAKQKECEENNRVARRHNKIVHDVAKKYCKEKMNRGLDNVAFIQRQISLGEEAEVLCDKQLLPEYNRPELIHNRQTSKSLSRDAAKQGNVNLVLDSEASFLQSYLKSGRNDVTSLLKGYDGDADSDSSLSAGAICLSRLVCNVLMLIQPAEAKSFYSHSAFFHNGLIARFLAYHVLDTEMYPCRDADGKPHDEYIRRIRHLLETHYTQDAEQYRATLELSDSGRKEILEFKALVARRCYSASEDVKASAEKLSGQVVRLAASLHVWKYALTGNIAKCKIEQGDIKFAIKLCMILFDNSFNHINGTEKLFDDAWRVWRWISTHCNNTEDTFKSSDVERNVNGLNKKKAAPVLDILEQYGYIRQVKSPSRSTVCVVNKNAFFIGAQNV